MVRCTASKQVGRLFQTDEIVCLGRTALGTHHLQADIRSRAQSSWQCHDDAAQLVDDVGRERIEQPDRGRVAQRARHDGQCDAISCRNFGHDEPCRHRADCSGGEQLEKDPDRRRALQVAVHVQQDCTGQQDLYASTPRLQRWFREETVSARPR